MHKVIIIDDEPHAIALLQLCLNELYQSVQVAGNYTDWKSALQALREEEYDLVFMDVMMPGKTGIELARLLPQLHGKLVFVTAHEEYALDAFRCHAAGYLLKPVDELELGALMDRMLPTLAPRTPADPAQKSKLLGVPGVKGIEYINTGDIIYLQADHKCTKIVLSGQFIYSSYNLGMFREYLDASFFQVHRSYIIRLSAVKRYLSSVTAIVMENDKEIPVARAAKDELLRQFKTLNRITD